MLPFSRSTIVLAATVLALLIVVSSTIYTVSEGYVGIVKRFGKAIGQVDPGIHVKIPFVDAVTNIEVRQRKTVEDLQAATEDQLPIAAAGEHQLDGPALGNDRHVPAIRHPGAVREPHPQSPSCAQPPRRRCRASRPTS